MEKFLQIIKEKKKILQPLLMANKILRELRATHLPPYNENTLKSQFYIGKI